MAISMAMVWGVFGLLVGPPLAVGLAGVRQISVPPTVGAGERNRAIARRNGRATGSLACFVARRRVAAARSVEHGRSPVHTHGSRAARIGVCRVAVERDAAGKHRKSNAGWHDVRSVNWCRAKSRIGKCVAAFHRRLRLAAHVRPSFRERQGASRRWSDRFVYLSRRRIKL